MNKFLFLLYIIVIIILHAVPTGLIEVDKFVLWHLRGDYLFHIAIFLPWMGLVRLELAKWPDEKLTNAPKRWIRSPLFWLLIGILVAAGAEMIQYWLPHRTFNMIDLMFNVSGIVAGSVVYVDRVWRYGKQWF